MLRTDWATNEYRLKNDLYGGIGYYRIVKPAEILKDYYDIDIIGKGYAGLGKTQEERMEYIFNKYDLVFTRHVQDAKLMSDFIACAKYFKKPIIMDMDDNFLDIKPDNPAYKDYEPGSQSVMMLSAGLGLVDAITVSTLPLVDKYKRFNENIHHLPNFNDINDWPLKAKRLTNRRIIGYAGSITHDSDLISVINPLKEIFRKYPDVDFEVVGAIGEIGPFKEAFGDFRDRVHAYGGSPAWDNYNKILSEMTWNVAICPLEDDDFTRSKSHIKWMEYTMMGWPVIASDVEPYKVIRQGKTGFLCKTHRDWVDALSIVLENGIISKELVENATQEIKENWQWKDNVEKYRQVFDKYLRR
jgi:glycosyltransferase involved in cell wall biosynthesis